MRNQTTEEILETFDVNRQTLARWIKQGCPCTRGKGKPNRFDETEVASWMKEKGLTGKAGRPAGEIGEQLAAAKLRKENAMAELHEIRVARERGTLVDRAEQERSNVAKFTVIRNKLMSLPASAAPVLAGMNAPEIEGALESRIREALTELSRKQESWQKPSNENPSLKPSRSKASRQKPKHQVKKAKRSKRS